MTIMKQRLLLVLLVAFIPFGVNAYDVKIDGIYYNLVTKANMAEVTYGDDKYSGDIIIPKTVEHEGVKYDVITIGKDAFQYAQLSSITIPNSIKTIGENSFYYCSVTTVNICDLEAWCKIDFGNTGASPFERAEHFTLNGEEVVDLIVPNGVSKINRGAFAYCKSIKTVKMPDTIIEIDGNAFRNCTNLIMVSLSNNLTSIGIGIFRNCKSLESIIIPEGVTVIPEVAFQYCESLTSIRMGEQTKQIDGRAFQCCKNLTSINFPKSISGIGSAAFDGCEKLSYIEIPKEAQSVSIGEGAFYNCVSLDSISIPNVWGIGKLAFNQCIHLKKVRFWGEIKYDISDSFQGCIELADVFCYDKKVPSASINAFKDSYIEYATLHVPAKSIDDYKATEPWSGFGKIVALDDEPGEDEPVGDIFTDTTDGIKMTFRILDREAKTCQVGVGEQWKPAIAQTGIFNLIIPETAKGYKVISIGDYAFAECISLETATVPTTVTTIGRAAFQGCSMIKTINIPSTVNDIQGFAFNGCSSLVDISLPEGIKTIGPGTFQACRLLTSITIPSTVTAIGSAAFNLDTKLENVNLPEELLSIGEAAFSDCNSITNIYIPYKVEEITYGGGFSECQNLSVILVSFANPNYDSRNMCNAIIETSTNTLIAGCSQTIIPNTVTSIGYGAFSGCLFTSITIPESVTSIGEYAFLKTKIESITLPEGLKSIGKYAFANCNFLKLVEAKMPSPVAIEENVFTNVYPNATLKVPNSSIELYKQTTGWCNFSQIIGINSVDPLPNPEPEPNPEITGAYLEYFIDKDPGYGKAMIVKDIDSDQMEIDLDNVKPGAHMLYVRSRDEQGRWSTTVSRPLYVRQPVSIVALEYFFDNEDPGKGKGVQVVPPIDTSKPYEFEVSLGNLPVGEHRLNVRVKGNDGIWTALTSGLFTLVENTGINELDTYREPSVTYTLKGYKVKEAKGVNIVRYKDGTTKKVMMK